MGETEGNAVAVLALEGLRDHRPARPVEREHIDVCVARCEEGEGGSLGVLRRPMGGKIALIVRQKKSREGKQNAHTLHLSIGRRPMKKKNVLL